MRSSLYLGLPIIAAVLLLDQATKAMVLGQGHWMRHGLEILPFLDLVLISNEGVSFGMLADLPWWLLVVVTLAVVAYLVHLLLQAPSRGMVIALGAIIGGALGNLVDRWRFGAVTDFIDLHLGDWHWPAFNLADTAIVLGTAGLLIHTLFNSSAHTIDASSNS